MIFLKFMGFIQLFGTTYLINKNKKPCDITQNIAIV